MRNSSGYIAISSVLVILAVTLTIFISVTLLSIDGAQISLAEVQDEEVVNIIDSCLEDALLYLNNNNSLPSSISLPEGSCNLTQESHSGDNWIFAVSGSINGYSKTMRANVDRNTTIVVNSWQEI